MTTSLFFSLFFFFLSLGIGFFLPGFLVLKALQKDARFPALVTFLLSFGLSLFFLDASLLFLGNIPVALTATNIALWYAALLLPLAFFVWRKNAFINTAPLKAPRILASKKDLALAALILIALFFVKSFYLAGTILPTATDLGHHLYWSQAISTTHILPEYAKQDILVSSENHYSLGDPEPIADFIIGEHLPLAFLQIFIGFSYTSAFPILFLFLLNLLSVLALAALAYTITTSLLKTFPGAPLKSNKLFLAALFLFGILFSLASPEMKFVSGGVIGNLFGNLFIPLILLCLLHTLVEKNASLLGITFLLLATLAYTHHLSTFILLYIFAAFFVVSLFFLGKSTLATYQSWLKLLLRPAAFLPLVAILLFAGFVALPTYLETHAVSTAVGTPTKGTRTGLTLAELTASNSAFKVGTSFFALLFILVLPRLRKTVPGILLFSYGSVLLLMALFPVALYVNIPSARIANYTSFPLGLLALFTVSILYVFLQKYFSSKISFSSPLAAALFLLFILALVAPGLEDNSQTINPKNQSVFVVQTFAAAQYLTPRTNKTDIILKDHNFIEASDTWMKLFFQRGYNYPLSRSFFKRYEDNPNREQCTLAAISTPNTPFGKQCYRELDIQAVIVNPNLDSAQFLKSPDFSLVYSAPDIAIFWHNNK
jgi:hypothetical protein